MPAEVQLRNDTTEQGEYEYECSFRTRQAGEHKTLVHYDELLLPQTPLAFRVLRGFDPRVVVHAEGDGLENGFARERREFEVFFEGAYVENVQVKIVGPMRDAQVRQLSKHELSAKYEYMPMEAGSYSILIRVNEVDITGSPFDVLIEDKFNVQLVDLKLPGEGHELRVGELCRLLANLRESGHKPFAAYANMSNEQAVDESPLDVRPLNSDGLSFQVLLTPTAQGIARSIS